MYPLIEQIECLLLPQMRSVASEMRKKHCNLKFNLWHAPEGTLTDWQGYSLGIECIFPRDTENVPKNVALSVDLCHLTSAPKLAADVIWGHPSGEVEASFPEDRGSMRQWSEATPETLTELRKALPKLIQAFETAVQRERPLSPPKTDLSGMTTNERIYVAGMMPEWDAAARARNRERMVEILCTVGLGSHSDQIADAVLASPKRYGF
jgi:hypothetical protein